MSKPQKSTEQIPKSVINTAWILVIGAIMPMLDSTMVNISIEKLNQDFATSLSTIQWVITGFVLTTAIAVPIAGWLVQKYNGKRIFLYAEILFMVSSLLSGLAWNVESLIAFRLIQGFASGLIVTLITTLLVEVAGAEFMGRIMAIVGVPIVLGPILGPVIGGFIVQSLTWRYIFFINLPFGLIAVYLIIKKLPDFVPTQPDSKLDFIGISLLGLSSSAIIYGISAGSTQSSFFNTSTVSFVGIGLALLLTYVIYASRVGKKAILPLTLFKSKSFTGISIGLFLTGIATNGPMMLLPLFFQNVRGFSVINAALIMIPQGVGMLLARPTIGKLVDKIGARVVVLTSLAITVIGTLPFLFFDKSSNLVLIGVFLLIRGAGIGGISIPMMADAYTGLEKSEIAQASVGTRIVQNLGGSFGSAVLATVVSSSMSGQKPSVPLLTTAYQNGFLVALIVSLVIILPSFLLTNKIKKSAD
ncbi:MDR family MFS transporter [Lactococcus insecticola]|uniref:MFS transporter n=1 Tax=Pseudolactococcus insecticola TaxID=2709158 RepID=A0A6A0B5U6_9LACT|nr:MDR family MFS transporter [Lactococcus insecticola]GFH40085.1 MFS transporter [Lactococcus insecticola]